VLNVVIGLDPGTGVASPTGCAAFDPDSKEIFFMANVYPARGIKEFHKRIRSIAELCQEFMLAFSEQDYKMYTYCESFVMRGKGGEMLARLTGALMASVPTHAEFDTVANTTVKKLVGAHGHADKRDVAVGVLAWFSKNKESVEKVEQAIKAADWDKIDALAIGIAGWMRETRQG